MPIQYVSGDLFANQFDAQAFAHGYNCQGQMGAGIAVEFKQRYPAMYKEYRRRCLAHPRQFNLGDALLWKEEGKPWVFNLGTQEHYWHARASYEAILSPPFPHRSKIPRVEFTRERSERDKRGRG